MEPPINPGRFTHRQTAATDPFQLGDVVWCCPPAKCRQAQDLVGVIPTSTNAVLSETHRTWNRPEAAELGKLADPSCVIAAIEMADGEMRALADIVAELLQERGEALVDLLWRQRHQLLAEAMIQHVGVVQQALALFRAPLAEGEQGAKPAIGRAILRIAQQARRIREIEPAPDDQADRRNLLCRLLAAVEGAHDPRQCVAIRHADRLIAQRRRLRRQLLRPRPALQEGEVGGDLKLDGAEGHFFSAASAFTNF